MMQPPTHETPKLWTAKYYGPQGEIVSIEIEAFTYESGTYFFFRPDKTMIAVSMEATGYVAIVPHPGPAES